jgi:hypothetical protein
MSARRQVAGQAAAEAAIGMLVFVTVLMFGLHFAEVGYLTVKIQEAANGALWDTTAKKMHDIPNQDFTLYQQAISSAGPDATDRYADFDGRTSQNRGVSGPNTVVQVFTRASNIDVRCENDQQFVPLQPTAPATPAIPQYNSAMSCTAKSTLQGYRIPSWFLDQNASGFFDTQHSKNVPFAVCAAGAPDMGRCQGRYVILLDDWGLDGKQERGECQLNKEGAQSCGGGGNNGYFQLAAQTYNTELGRQGLSGNRSSSNLAQQVVGQSPISDEQTFFMSFRGSESQYTEHIDPTHMQGDWETTPFKQRQEYRDYSAPRDDCWLGLNCN